MAIAGKSSCFGLQMSTRVMKCCQTSLITHSTQLTRRKNKRLLERKRTNKSKLDGTVPVTVRRRWIAIKAVCHEANHKCLEDEVAQRQREEDEARNRDRRDCEGRLVSASCNLEPEFQKVARHRVFSTPYTNVLLVAELVRNANPLSDQAP